MKNPLTSFLNVLRVYGQRLKAFQPNARLYLINVIIVGAVMGIYRLLFNFYVLSLGFDEALLGNLVAVSSMAGLITVLPMGYLADLLGRKASLLIAGFGTVVTIAALVLWPSQWMLVAMTALSGVAGALAGVTMSPFLMENSGEQERTYLFSFGNGLQMVSSSVGNWIGGYLPTWVAMTLGASVSAVSAEAYGGALVVVSGAAAIGLFPLLLLRTPKLGRAQRTVFAPITYAMKNPALLAKLISPMLITSIGAGLTMPFMNVFFRQQYGQPDNVIGTLFAWGSLAMGVGLLLAPPLADRIGKIRLVVITQGLSIPFLILLGFAPWFWLSTAAYFIRVALMNMSGPVYQTYVMEHVEPSARATVASLVSMSWNVGWFISPMVSGWLQVRYGFAPPFIGTIILYTISVFLYWSFFWRATQAKAEPVPAPLSGD